jgi:hypothetical protein
MSGALDGAAAGPVDGAVARATMATGARPPGPGPVTVGATSESSPASRASSAAIAAAIASGRRETPSEVMVP